MKADNDDDDDDDEILYKILPEKFSEAALKIVESTSMWQVARLGRAPRVNPYTGEVSAADCIIRVFPPNMGITTKE